MQIHICFILFCNLNRLGFGFLIHEVEVIVSQELLQRAVERMEGTEKSQGWEQSLARSVNIRLFTPSHDWNSSYNGHWVCFPPWSATLREGWLALCRYHLVHVQVPRRINPSIGIAGSEVLCVFHVCVLAGLPVQWGVPFPMPHFRRTQPHLFSSAAATGTKYYTGGLPWTFSVVAQWGIFICLRPLEFTFLENLVHFSIRLLG